MPLIHAWPEPCPLTVTCLGCGKTAQTYDYQHPDRAVECSCCPVNHDHGAAAECPRTHEGLCGKGVPGCNVCRPVNVTGCAHLRVFEVADLLDAARGQGGGGGRDGGDAGPAVTPGPVTSRTVSGGPAAT